MTPIAAHSAGHVSTGEEQQPWRSPEARWRGVVEHIRAGCPLRPRAWKNGARCAVGLSFDGDHESGELRKGGTSPGRLSQGQYGVRAAVPACSSCSGNTGSRELLRARHDRAA